MKTVSIHDAKTNLSKYIAAAKRGEVVAIGAYGRQEVWLSAEPPKPTAKPAAKFKRQSGTLRGKVYASPDAFSKELDIEITKIIEESTIFPDAA